MLDTSAQDDTTPTDLGGGPDILPDAGEEYRQGRPMRSTSSFSTIESFASDTVGFSRYGRKILRF